MGRGLCHKEPRVSCLLMSRGVWKAALGRMLVSGTRSISCKFGGWHKRYEGTAAAVSWLCHEPWHRSKSRADGAYAPNVHPSCIQHAPNTHAPNIHPSCIQHALNNPTCIQHAPFMHPTCMHPIRMHPTYTQYACTQHTPNMHAPNIHPSCIQHALNNPTCIQHAPFMHPTCMHPIRIQHTPFMHPTCTQHCYLHPTCTQHCYLHPTCTQRAPDMRARNAHPTCMRLTCIHHACPPFPHSRLRAHKHARLQGSAHLHLLLQRIELLIGVDLAQL